MRAERYYVGMRTWVMACVTLSAFVVAMFTARSARAQELAPIAIDAARPVATPASDGAAHLTVESAEVVDVTLSQLDSAPGSVMRASANCSTPCQFDVAPGRYELWSTSDGGFSQRLRLPAGSAHVRVRRAPGRSGYGGLMALGVVSMPVGLLMALAGALENVCLFCSYNPSSGNPLMFSGLAIAGTGLVTAIVSGVLRARATSRVETIAGVERASRVPRVTGGLAVERGSASALVQLTF
jgi:hypothetical protein